MSDSTITSKFALYNGDCIEVMRNMPANSVHYSVFSPPFSSLYTYSNSPRDMGNVRSDSEFFEHFAFLVDELMRVLKPGRLLSFHCMPLQASNRVHGNDGIRDFPGDLIRAFQSKGGIFHSEVVIWKDPVVAAQRTHAKGLLYCELMKDSTSSRQGFADYLITIKKPGLNEEPVSKVGMAEWPSATTSKAGVHVWQRYASPVWMDISPSDTLQYRSARENDDERHICPLQLEVIRRAVRLWTNPGDVVLSPFAGIGSEGYVAIQEGRKFVGAELKTSYYNQAVKNMNAASVPKRELFDTEAS